MTHARKENDVSGKLLSRRDPPCLRRYVFLLLGVCMLGGEAEREGCRLATHFMLCVFCHTHTQKNVKIYRRQRVKMYSMATILQGAVKKARSPKWHHLY